MHEAPNSRDGMHMNLDLAFGLSWRRWEFKQRARISTCFAILEAFLQGWEIRSWSLNWQQVAGPHTVRGNSLGARVETPPETTTSMSLSATLVSSLSGDSTIDCSGRRYLSCSAILSDRVTRQTSL